VSALSELSRIVVHDGGILHRAIYAQGARVGLAQAWPNDCATKISRVVLVCFCLKLKNLCCAELVGVIARALDSVAAVLSVIVHSVLTIRTFQSTTAANTRA
jgi:hypothetical protein